VHFHKLVPFVGASRVNGEKAEGCEDHLELVGMSACDTGAGRKANQNDNFFVKELFRLNVIGWLEELQYHDNEKIYDEANEIIGKYFEHEDPLNIGNLEKNMI
jgi:hypothetical protein